MLFLIPHEICRVAQTCLGILCSAAVAQTDTPGAVNHVPFVSLDHVVFMCMVVMLPGTVN